MVANTQARADFYIRTIWLCCNILLGFFDDSIANAIAAANGARLIWNVDELVNPRNISNTICQSACEGHS